MKSGFSGSVAIVGSGQWGVNHVRTAVDLLGIDRVVVVDSDPGAGERIRGNIGPVRFTTSLTDVLSDPAATAAIVATPAATHYLVARQLLEHSKHVLVEKPMALTSAEAENLVAHADQHRVTLMVGHLLLYHPAIMKIRDMMGGDQLGSLQYVYSHRLNLGAVRTEENILWSFAPHDISILQYLLGETPRSVHAHGARILQHDIEDTTITHLRYPGGVAAHIYVSWLHPFKEHRLVVIGNAGMVVFEDTLMSGKLRLYPKGFHATDRGLVKFEGESTILEYENKKPLEEEQRHFYTCIETGVRPRTDGIHAVENLKILELATRSLHHG